MTANSAKALIKALVLPLAVLLAFELWARATHLQSDSLAPPSEIVMKFDHVVGLEARHLVQVVDVLGDDRRNLAGPVERSQRAMPAAGLRRRKCRLHRKAPPPRFVPRVRAGDEFIKRDRAVTRPQPAG